MGALLGAIDYSGLTTGLTSLIEAAVTQVLPVLAVVIGAVLSVKLIRKFLRA